MAPTVAAIAAVTLASAGLLAGPGAAAIHGPATLGDPDPFDVEGGTLTFAGSPTADLYTLEVNTSLRNAWKYDCNAGAPLPAGYCQASPTGQLWAGSFWSRDGGTFTRELILSGRYSAAKTVLQVLLKDAQLNAQGFYSFPEYYQGPTAVDGFALDGTSGIVLCMVLLWQRLPPADPFRETVFQWLHADSSPLRFYLASLSNSSAAGDPALIASSGEFGCSCCVDDVHHYCWNTVSNGLAATALRAGAALELHAPSGSAGNATLAAEYSAAADAIQAAMAKMLFVPGANATSGGQWMFSMNGTTRAPFPGPLDPAIEGVTSMLADWGTLVPLEDVTGNGDGVVSSPLATLAALGQQTLATQAVTRGACLMQTGMWMRFDASQPACTGVSGAYDGGYAMQAMLLFDQLNMADAAINGIANVTYGRGQKKSVYDFFEQYHWPPSPGMGMEGCGELNLVSVSEPVKASRLTLGVDDMGYNRTVRFVPRLLPSWGSISATNWPVRVADGVVARVDMNVSRVPASPAGPGCASAAEAASTQLCVTVTNGIPLPHVRVRVWDGAAGGGAGLGCGVDGEGRSRLAAHGRDHVRHGWGDTAPVPGGAWAWLEATNVSHACFAPQSA